MATTYKSLKEILGVDPTETKAGGLYRHFGLSIYDIVVDKESASALMDVGNSGLIVGTTLLDPFAAECAAIQLMFGYRCHKENTDYKGLAGSLMKSRCIDLTSPINLSTKIPLGIVETTPEMKGKIAHVTYIYDVGNGAFAGQIYETLKVG